MYNSSPAIISPSLHEQHAIHSEVLGADAAYSTSSSTIINKTDRKRQKSDPVKQWRNVLLEVLDVQSRKHCQSNVSTLQGFKFLKM